MPKAVQERLNKEAPRLFTVRTDKRALEAEEKTLVASIRPDVIAFGENTELDYPQDTIINTAGFKVHNCAAASEKFNMAAGIVWMREQITLTSDLEKKAELERLLISLLDLQETIDEKRFRTAMALKLIPQEMIDVVVSESVNYKLLVHEIKG